MKKVLIFLLLASSLFGESRYICTIQQIYNAYTLKTFRSFGIDSIDKMIFTLKNGKLTHHFKNYKKEDSQIVYINKSSGNTTMYKSSEIEKVKFTEFQQNSSTPIIIYSFDNFNKIIRINMESIGTYSCTKF